MPDVIFKMIMIGLIKVNNNSVIKKRGGSSRKGRRSKIPEYPTVKRQRTGVLETCSFLKIWLDDIFPCWKLQSNLHHLAVKLARQWRKPMCSLLLRSLSPHHSHRNRGRRWISSCHECHLILWLVWWEWAGLAPPWDPDSWYHAHTTNKFSSSLLSQYYNILTFSVDHFCYISGPLNKMNKFLVKVDHFLACLNDKLNNLVKMMTICEQSNKWVQASTPVILQDKAYSKLQIIK